MTKKYFFQVTCCFALIFSSVNLSAQSNLDLLPQDVLKETNESLSNALNALVIFSSSSSVGSGTFGFRDDVGPDPELEVMRLIGQYDFAKPEQESFAPFIKGGVGRTKLKEVIPDFLEQGGKADFSTLTTLSATVGAGIDLELARALRFVPYFDFVYSYTESEYDFNNAFSQEILALFDKDIVNWHIHTFSYNPGAMLYYTYPVGRAAFIPSVNYTHVFLDGRSTDSNLLDVSTSSGVLQTKLKLELPFSKGTGRAGLYGVPSFSRTDIYGDARDALGLGHYHEVGMALIAKEQNILPLLREVGLSAGYAFASDMWGWRVGLEGAF